MTTEERRNKEGYWYGLNDGKKVGFEDGYKSGNISGLKAGTAKTGNTLYDSWDRPKLKQKKIITVEINYDEEDSFEMCLNAVRNCAKSGQTIGFDNGDKMNYKFLVE